MSKPAEVELSHADAVRRAARGVMSVAGRQALVRLLAFLGMLALARLIAPSSFGVFITAQFILSLLQALAVGGITSALVRRSETLENDDYRTALAIQQIQALVVVVGLYFVAPLVTQHYDLPENQVWVFRSLALAVFPLSVRAISLAKLQRSLRHDLVALCEVLEYVVYVGVAIVLALIGWDVWALVVATLARCVIGAVVMHLFAGGPLRLGMSAGRVRVLLGSAIPLQVQMLIDLSQRSVVPVAVGSLVGIAAVGVLGMANTILDALILQPLVLVASIQLRLFARVQHERAKVRALMEDFYAAGAMVLLPLLIFLSISAPRALPVALSGEWADVGHIILWLMLSSAIQIVTVPTAQAAKALGELGAPLVAGLLNFGVQIALIGVLAKTSGIYAYPIAATIGACIGASYLLFRVGQRVGHKTPLVIVPVVAVNIACGVLYWLAINILDSVLHVAVVIALLVPLYAVAITFVARRHLVRLLRFISKTGPKRLQAIFSATASFLDRQATQSTSRGH